jgi:hypothetical protein
VCVVCWPRNMCSEHNNSHFSMLYIDNQTDGINIQGGQTGTFTYFSIPSGTKRRLIVEAGGIPNSLVDAKTGATLATLPPLTRDMINTTISIPVSLAALTTRQGPGEGFTLTFTGPAAAAAQAPSGSAPPSLATISETPLADMLALKHGWLSR